MNKPSKRLIILQTFLIFVLPVLLLYFNVVSKSWVFFFLCIGALSIYGIIYYEKWTHKEMGLRHDNLKKSIPIYLGFTILSIGVLFLLSWQLDLVSINARNVLFQKLLLFIPISFFQEFAFRSFLMHRLQLIFKSGFTIILVNTILFTLIHIIYPGLDIVLPITFVGGIFFASLYYKYPNLLLTTLAHSVINITAVLLGFFTIQ